MNKFIQITLLFFAISLCLSNSKADELTNDLFLSEIPEHSINEYDYDLENYANSDLGNKWNTFECVDLIEENSIQFTGGGGGEEPPPIPIGNTPSIVLFWAIIYTLCRGRFFQIRENK